MSNVSSQHGSMFSTLNVDFIEHFINKKAETSKNSLLIFAIKHIARRELPYGLWGCGDGRMVWFNREYQPIFQVKDGVISYADRSEWVKDIKSQVFVYDDNNSPVRYLTKHLGVDPLTAKESKECRLSLLRCLCIIRDLTPKESGSVNPSFSLGKY